MQIIYKTGHIFLATITILLLIPFSARAASDSATQRLYLTILPAIEVTVLQDYELEATPTTLYGGQTVGVRANTPWTLEATPVASDLYNPVLFSIEGSESEALSFWGEPVYSGESNKDDNYQLLDATYSQEVSWGDQPGPQELTVIYQAYTSL